VYHKHEISNFYLKNVFVAQLRLPKKLFFTKFSRKIKAKNGKKIISLKMVTETEKIRKLNQSRIKFYNM